MICKRLSTWCVLVLACGIAIAISTSNASQEKEAAKHEKRLALTIEVSKEVYKAGEAVPLVIRIKNDGPEGIYISKAEPYIKVTDVNGLVISGAPIDEPPEAPAHYYIQRGDKQIYTVPVSFIEGSGELVEQMEDALERYHSHISNGSYYLQAKIKLSVYEKDSTIQREDMPVKTWVEPRAAVWRAALVSNMVKIQLAPTPIRKSAAVWVLPLICAMIVGSVLLFVVVRKRTSSVQR